MRNDQFVAVKYNMRWFCQFFILILLSCSYYNKRLFYSNLWQTSILWIYLCRSQKEFPGILRLITWLNWLVRIEVRKLLFVCFLLFFCFRFVFSFRFLLCWLFTFSLRCRYLSCAFSFDCFLDLSLFSLDGLVKMQPVR